MEKAASVFLCDDITIEDAKKLSYWLNNPQVTRYLNEKRGVAADLESLAQSASPLLFFSRFNRGGRFFMIHREDRSIGFVRLIKAPTANDYEIVLVIGEEELWGKGYGTRVIHLCLKKCFFEWRAGAVAATVCHANARSLRAFSRAGFRARQDTEHVRRLLITMDDFLESRRKK